jgi:pyruvate-formate lyase-activating enzyme
MNILSKSWRLVRILLDYRAGREKVRTPPIRLWIESTARCNLRCVMCPNKDMHDSEKGVMSLELFRTLIDQIAGRAHDIYLHHRGEPLLNPALFDMIRYAAAHGLRTRFHSNGCLLTPDKAAKLLDAPPDMISFSIDGFEKETYERVRVGAVFEETLANVFGFLEKRRARGFRKPYVIIEKILFRGRTETPETRARIAALTRRFLDAGADEVIEKEEYEWAGDTAPAEPAACPARRLSKCTFPWYAMVVLWNATVTPCPQDFRGKMVMGNAATTPLLDIWNGPAYRALRAAYKGNIEAQPLCRNCDRLRRKTVGGLPLQYMVTFLADHLLGYNALRRRLGSAERNR